jgi:quercetin dioxygenase-like cupin family protein
MRGSRRTLPRRRPEDRVAAHPQFHRDHRRPGGLVHRHRVHRHDRRPGGHVALRRGQRALRAGRPHGQTIWITEGVGLCQREGGPIEVLRPGDRVFFEPGENHWHGAAASRFMVHVAMQQADEDGSPVTWGAHVTDEQYAAQPAPEG